MSLNDLAVKVDRQLCKTRKRCVSRQVLQGVATARDTPLPRIAMALHAVVELARARLCCSQAAPKWLCCTTTSSGVLKEEWSAFRAVTIAVLAGLALTPMLLKCDLEAVAGRYVND